jgi:hypothetical protein
MGRKQKPAAKVEANYNASRAAASQPSPYEERLGRMSQEVLDWAAKGDYRDRPKTIFTNFADPAARKRQREVLANTRGQGVGAMGAGANPTLLALDKQHQDDVFERDTAAQYEADTAQGVAQAAGLTGDLARMDQARRLGVLGSDASLYGAQLSKPEKPKWWERLLGGAANAGAAFAGSEAGSALIAGAL